MAGVPRARRQPGAGAALEQHSVPSGHEEAGRGHTDPSAKVPLQEEVRQWALLVLIPWGSRGLCHPKPQKDLGETGRMIRAGTVRGSTWSKDNRLIIDPCA